MSSQSEIAIANYARITGWKQETDDLKRDVAKLKVDVTKLLCQNKVNELMMKLLTCNTFKDQKDGEEYQQLKCDEISLKDILVNNIPECAYKMTSDE